MANIVAVDTSHILYREFYRQVGNKPASRITERDLEIAKKKAIKKLQGYKRKDDPDKFILAFDDRTSWRTQMTRDANMRLYKHNRKKSVRDQRLQKVFNSFRSDMKKELRKKPGFTVVSGNKLESDDILAGVARVKSKKDKLKVITSDKDMRQLMLKTGVSVVDIKSGKEMSRKNIREDLFKRAMRGRHAYNVVSVFKNLSEQDLQRAYDDPDYLADLFRENEENTDTNITARKRFFRNRQLFNMDEAPREIKKRVRSLLKTKVFA